MSEKKSQFQQRLEALGFQQYSNSALWFDKKAEYAASDLPKECQHCGDSKYLLHHLTYERLGQESLSDFMALCNRCHHRLHAIMKGTVDSQSLEETTAYMVPLTVGLRWALR